MSSHARPRPSPTFRDLPSPRTATARWLRQHVAHAFVMPGSLPTLSDPFRSLPIPSQVRWLREHDTYARAVAMAGRARMAALNTDAVADYMAELLKQ